MPQKRCTSEQIVAKLRQVDVAVAPRVIVGRARRDARTSGRGAVEGGTSRTRYVSDASRLGRVASRTRCVLDALPGTHKHLRLRITAP